MGLSVVILAAGKGTRMRSQTPKVLHEIAGKPMLQHVISTALQLQPDRLLTVIGHQAEQITTALNGAESQWVMQQEQRGTGHALMQAMPQIHKQDQILVLSGDVPGLSAETLKRFLSDTPKSALGIITSYVQNPLGLGRIIRDADGEMLAIREEKDATADEKKIKEINAGIMLMPAKLADQLLPKLQTNNAQGEYYLTDLAALAAAEHISLSTTSADEFEVSGVNTRLQLHLLERHFQYQQACKLMERGATLRDATRVDIRGTVAVEPDVVIDVNCVFEGQVVIGSGTYIEPNCVLRNVVLGENVHVKANSVIEDAKIENHCEIGPFARLRPGTELKDGVKIGNFVETKKARIGEGSKVSHLSYIGDTYIGRHVNVGAGTITCNYDGVNKHQTIIEDDVFIGSDTQLIAPIQVGAGATIGAGTTLTKDAPAGALTLSRAKQVSVDGWKRPVKKDGE